MTALKEPPMISTLKDALTERGFETLTDVQEAVTAPELVEADLLVSAQTGSGKTVGFGLAIASTLLGEAETFEAASLPLALVIAPTRELALQVQRELSWLYAKAGAVVVSCIGGMDPRNERRALERGAHIVVGTPGRLRDHIMRGAFDMSGLRAVVLDEADEMLDLGFREDLEFMLAEAPAEKRTLLFSATVPPAIVEIAKQYQRDAVRVTTISRGVQHSDISYQVVKVAPADAEVAIINLLRFHDAPTSIVFANTRATVARLTARLANRGLAVVSLSGELSQDERSHALQAMRDGRARVCVATDVAARGIDLPNLDLVVHADLPTNTEALLHRSGRTGRAGRKGVSVLIAPERAAGKAQRLLKWAKITADWVEAPSADEILALDEQRLRAAEVWQGEVSEDEARFAAELAAERSPEALAIACLRLYRANLSAPEELGIAPVRGDFAKPDRAYERPERAPRTDRAEFGPSVWFELSVGQDKRAEARWILPMLCKAGGLDKTQIGRIKIDETRSYVEIAEAAAEGLRAQVGPAGLLDDGIRLSAFDGVPDVTRAPARTSERPSARAAERRPERPSDAPRGPRKFDGPRKSDGPYKSDKPRAGARSNDAPRSDARPAWDKPRPSSAPKGPRRFDDARPARPRDEARPASAKRYDPNDDARTSERKPRMDRKTPRPAAAATPAAPKPATTLRPGAADVSQRMERPGAKPKGPKPGFGKPAPKGAKPFGKPARKPGGKPGGFGKPGGSAPPRRKP